MVREVVSDVVGEGALRRESAPRLEALLVYGSLIHLFCRLSGNPV
jgi:hypothetical protein